MLLIGNIATAREYFHGEIETEGSRISAIRRLGAPRDGADRIFPGFIDLHVHGMGPYDASLQAREMAQFAASTGMTGFLPTIGSAPHDLMCNLLKQCREAVKEAAPKSARILGSHLEGPFIAKSHHGGMDPKIVRDKADLVELEEFLAEAAGTMRLMTLSPEVPHAVEAVRRLVAAGVTVSAGHTGCHKEQLLAACDAGLTQCCHLFDTFDGRLVANGVSQPCLADLMMVEERINVEIICDGIHIPPDLVKLARMAVGADRLIAITDGLPGAGMPDGIYKTGNNGSVVVRAGDVIRNMEGGIVGSSLTLNYAVKNMVERFGFTPTQVAKMTSRNPARAIGLGDRTGELVPGKDADIAVLGADYAVRKTVVKGETAYEQ